MMHLQNLTRMGQAHDNLTKVISIYKDPFQYYLVMELVPGGNLLDFYNNYQEMSVKRCESMVKNIVG